MRIARKFRRSIERLGPYPSLFIVAVPLAIAEPLKLAAMFVAGDGHWMVDVIVMICAYATSLFITERLFRHCQTEPHEVAVVRIGVDLVCSCP